MDPAGNTMSLTGRLPGGLDSHRRSSTRADETASFAEAQVAPRLGVERERMPGHPFQVAAGGQLEAMKIGLPAESLIAFAHIFLMAATTLAGIGT